MTELTYVAVWPILDRARPVAALIADACQELDIMAELAGAKIIDVPVWTVSTDLQRLVCHAVARTFDPDKEDATRATVTPAMKGHMHRLAMNGMSAREIADKLGVSTTTAARYARQVR